MAKVKKQAKTEKIIRRWKIKKEFLKTNNECCKKGSLFNTAQVVTIVILTSLFSLIMGMAIANPNSKSDNKQISDAVEKFIEQYNLIKSEYYEDIDDEDAMKTALDAIVNSLDAYSTVVDDSLSNTLSTQLQGAYQGFGIQIVNDEEYNIIVVDVIADSPAETAGIQAYDIIRKIDDQQVAGQTTTEFVNFVKNSPKKTFELTVERNGQEIVLEINRQVVTLKSVATDIYENNNKKVGYIYVSLFAYNTDVQFAEALEALEKENIDSLIVDLRYNTGGHLTAVENMMSEFLDKSHVIYRLETKTETTKKYSKTDSSKSYDIVVLVNSYSASASEMFAATMQEEYGAIIMGTTTYGKGTVQEVIEDNQYKLTTKKWLTPKGNWINGVGVTPDIVVELNIPEDESFTEVEDNQLQEAITLLTK